MMNPDLKDAASAATRALLRGGPRLAVWWWAVLILSFAVTTVTRGILTTVETSIWQWAATAPKIMMLIVGRCWLPASCRSTCPMGSAVARSASGQVW